MMKVSSRTPKARAKPSCVMGAKDPPISNEAKVPAMMKPQLEMMPPVFAM